MADFEYLVEGTTAVLRLNRPEKLNAMNEEMNQGLIDGAARAESDPAIRSLVVTGTGRGFCAGADVSKLGERAGGKARGSAAWLEEFHERKPAPWPFTAMTKPTIAAVNGVAVGAGVEFATECDMRIAAQSARFGWVFAHRGLVPDHGAGTWLLERIVGLQNAAALLFSGEVISAERAKEIGFVVEVVPDEQLMERALTLAASVSRGGPLAIGEMKQLLYRAHGRDVAEHMRNHIVALEKAFASDDFREGVSSFLEKRPPVWAGR